MDFLTSLLLLVLFKKNFMMCLKTRHPTITRTAKDIIRMAVRFTAFIFSNSYLLLQPGSGFDDLLDGFKKILFLLIRNTIKYLIYGFIFFVFNLF